MATSKTLRNYGTDTKTKLSPQASRLCPTARRLGQYRLCKIVETLLHRNPYNGDTFIFMSKNRRVSKIVRYEYGKYLLYVIVLERDLKFMKMIHKKPIVNQDGSGVHYEIKWKQLVALLSCPVRSVIRI